MAPLASQSLLLDIATSVKGRLISVGERGHILLSDDGEQWRQVEVPTDSSLTAVFTLDNHAWAVGHDAVILYSQDAGQSWQLQHFDAEKQKPLMDVLFFDQQHGIAVGAYGLFYRTRDGGQSWQPEMHPELLDPADVEYLEELRAEDVSLYEQELSAILPHLNRLSPADGKLYLAGEAGLLAVSEDRGQSWVPMEVDYYGSFFDIEQTPSGRLLAAGLRGHLFEYQEDAGWQEIATGTKSSLNSIVVVDEQTTLVVGNNGYLIWLNDGVQTQQTEEEKAVVNAIPYDGRLLAVTETGIKVVSKK